MTDDETQEPRLEYRIEGDKLIIEAIGLDVQAIQSWANVYGWSLEDHFKERAGMETFLDSLCDDERIAPSGLADYFFSIEFDVGWEREADEARFRAGIEEYVTLHARRADQPK